MEGFVYKSDVSIHESFFLFFFLFFNFLLRFEVVESGDYL